MAKIFSSLDSQQIQKTDFEFKQLIGRGGFGHVYKVLHNSDRKIYALKEMSKALAYRCDGGRRALLELELLSKLDSPFLTNVAYAFQDQKNLYFVLDFMQGGDLQYQNS